MREGKREEKSEEKREVKQEGKRDERRERTEGKALSLSLMEAQHTQHNRVALKHFAVMMR